MTSVLSAQSLSKRFGGVRAVDDVSFEVNQGEIFGIIGPNGAGKSTLFSLIAGSDRSDGGEVRAFGRRIDRMAPFRRSRLGLGRTFQNSQVFGQSSIAENLLIAAVDHHARLGVAVERRAKDVLDLVDLVDAGSRDTSSLALFDQQKLSIGMALMSKPDLLLLDEPSGGLVELEVGKLADLLGRVRDAGVTILVIDHKMRLMMNVCDRILAMASGKTLCVGRPAEIVKNPQVRTAYLGKGDRH